VAIARSLASAKEDNAEAIPMGTGDQLQKFIGAGRISNLRAPATTSYPGITELRQPPRAEIIATPTPSWQTEI